MNCHVCGSDKVRTSKTKADIICSECGTPFHISGRYFYYMNDDSNF